MNYGKYIANCCKHCICWLICNELACIDQGNKLLRTTIWQSSNSNVFLHDYFLHCILVRLIISFRILVKIIHFSHKKLIKQLKILIGEVIRMLNIYHGVNINIKIL